MLPEIAFLKVLMYNKNYIKYYKYININKYNYKELYIIYSLLPIYFEKYPKDSTIDEFSTFFFTYYPRLKPEEIDAYQSIFKQAAQAEVSEEKAEDVLREMERRSKALEIAEHALAFTEGREVNGSFQKAVEEWKELEARPAQIENENVFITDDLEQLKQVYHDKHGLRWRLKSLNRALGSIRIGNFGFVFARPETGKTTFLASEITHFAGQVEKPILWFNNEEEGNLVKTRCFQAALGLPLERLYADVAGNQKAYNDLTKGNIKIFDAGIISKKDVERLIEIFPPSLVVFDQIDKIKGFEADRNDLVMGSIYQWARQIAKTVAPVIGICQSDGSGEGIQWLTMANVADAKTAKQAEADWILGIGKTHNEEMERVRYFHLSKNKLQGDVDSDPRWRHGKWTVLIEPEIARYKDIGE